MTLDAPKSGLRDVWANPLESDMRFFFRRQNGCFHAVPEIIKDPAPGLTSPLAFFKRKTVNAIIFSDFALAFFKRQCKVIHQLLHGGVPVSTGRAERQLHVEDDRWPR